MLIHFDDCPAIEGINCYCEGRGYHDHACTCHAQQALDELVEAAEVVALHCPHPRLEGALKPFLERTHPTIDRDTMSKLGKP